MTEIETIVSENDLEKLRLVYGNLTDEELIKRVVNEHSKQTDDIQDSNKSN